jgi:biopolymer transport protein ExbD
MITSTLIAPNAVKLLLPKSNMQTQANPQVAISITGDIQYYVGTDKVAFEQIEPIIVNQLKNETDPTISLHADKSVPVEYVVNIMNIAKNNKYKVILATAPE